MFPDIPTAKLLMLSISLSAILVLNCIGLAVYRFYFHPLAKFPGPKLAAITTWYEFYWDVVKDGKFTFHIYDLHKKYGPIIRISPNELHIHDPDYFDQLYARSGRRDKYSYISSRFGYPNDAFFTAPHDLHKVRRKAISPFFSSAKISEFHPVILSKIDKLCRKIYLHQEYGQVLPLSKCWFALTTDIITEYAFAKSYDHLESEEFKDTDSFHKGFSITHSGASVIQHFPWLFTILDSLPDWIIEKIEPALKHLTDFRVDLANQVKEIRLGINEAHKQVDHPTIFQELIYSDLPPEDKSDARLGEEAQLILGAGLLTTSWALTVGSFHIINNLAILKKLTEEVHASGIASTKDRNWNKPEQLPYLHACIKESIRLAHSVPSRNPRMAPDQELLYGEWVIPKNTPVSMSNLLILMDERIYPNPREFRPERWIENPGLDKYFVPFGKGSRSCLGVTLAYAEMFTALAMIFTRFKFELFETDVSDVELEHVYMIPFPKRSSKGVRVKVSAL